MLIKNKDTTIEQLYEIFSKLKTISFKDLKKHIFENYDANDLEHLLENYTGNDLEHLLDTCFKFFFNVFRMELVYKCIMYEYIEDNAGKFESEQKVCIDAIISDINEIASKHKDCIDEIINEITSEHKDNMDEMTNHYTDYIHKIVSGGDFAFAYYIGCMYKLTNHYTNYIHKIYEFGNIKEGNTVIDLGASTGIDCLALRHLIIGDKGKVIGVDTQHEILNIIARKYRDILGYSNVDFIFGDAREIPLENNIADGVISRSTLTLISEKEKVFSEIFRVLKDGGSCYIDDAIIYGDNFDLLEKIKNDTSKANWCYNRSIREEEYFNILEKIGFKNIKIEIIDFNCVNDEGRSFNVTDIEKHQDRVISASIYIYAEK